MIFVVFVIFIVVEPDKQRKQLKPHKLFLRIFALHFKKTKRTKKFEIRFKEIK